MTQRHIGPTAPRPLAALAAGICLFLTGCSEGGSYEIDVTRTVAYRGEKLHATSAERFGMTGGGAAGSMTPDYKYVLPTGWTERPAKMFRDVNLSVGEVECYVSTLTGGGLAANVNRWRDEMSMAPYTTEELARLPRRQVLGREAVFVELAGDFTAKDGSKKPDHKMLAVYAQFPAFAVSVKMIGPQKEVDAARSGFDAFVGSLKIDMAGAMKGAGNHGGAGGRQQGFDRSKVKWDVPEGWQPGEGSAMRMVTLKVPPKKKDQPGCELWIIDLSGSAGGIVDNINRWRSEVQKPPLSAQDVDRLPRIQILGKDSPLLEEAGNYSGMGGPKLDKAMVFGVICPLADVTLFIKMVGGVEEMLSAKNDFLAFCKSLRLEK